jgi:glutamine synthetase
VVTLPQTLGQALDALAADTVLGSAVGDDFVAGFIETMRCEWIEY